MNEHGQQVQFVAAFTDTDLGTRFLDLLGIPAGSVALLRLATLDTVEAMFAKLQASGVEHITFDPGETHVRTVPIQAITDGIR